MSRVDWDLVERCYALWNGLPEHKCEDCHRFAMTQATWVRLWDASTTAWEGAVKLAGTCWILGLKVDIRDDMADGDVSLVGRRPPNRYRDLHRAIESLGDRASGVGLHAEANALWALAGAVKKKGKRP